MAATAFVLPARIAEKCARVLNQLNRTMRLLAELMYGSGGRLMELLRLRLHPNPD